jgi:hypothetical protein
MSKAAAFGGQQPRYIGKLKPVSMCMELKDMTGTCVISFLCRRPSLPLTGLFGH